MFDPNIPRTDSEMKSAEMRNQFNDLNNRLVSAAGALDWSNGAPKLPDYTTIAGPVMGNIVFNYSSGLMVFDGGDWQQHGN